MMNVDEIRFAGTDVKTRYAVVLGGASLLIAVLAVNCDAIVGNRPADDGRQVTQSVRQPVRQVDQTAKPERAQRSGEEGKQRSKTAIVTALLLLLSGFHR